MMTKSKLAIVILNWNGKAFLHRFLPVLLQNCPDYASIVVADNASTDGSLEMLSRTFEQIRIIKNTQNYGFSKGYNEALKQVEADYYCLLNSDIEVTSGWVQPIIQHMEQDTCIAAMQPKLRSYNQQSYFEYAGASGGFIDKYGYPFCRGRLFEVVEEDRGQYDQEMEVFWATGAALFVRSDVYHQAGGLDDDFFAHMEEIDFCWRVKNMGYKVMVCPQSVVYHVGGGTLPKNNSRKTFLNFRNNLFLLLKNLPAQRLFVTFFVRFFMDNLAAFVFLARGNWQDFFAVYKAFFSFARGIKNMKNKRLRIQNFDAYKDTCKTSIVFMHYILRKKYFDGKKFRS
ncbi:MAG: glycosyltransferase family 2 protein [Bacteroidales bacterium]|jgi:GT2 family glycosyltransferase|nr:glycosyltransferase family 2 protein [Bacteroidales bacterium]